MAVDVREAGAPSASPNSEADQECLSPERVRQGRVLVQSTTWRVYVLLCVTVCVMALVGVFGLVAYFSIKAVTEVNWSKYSTSKNWRLLMEWFPQLSTDSNTLRGERVIQWLMQGPLFSALDMTLALISGAFLTMLFLVFLLYNDALAVEETRGFANFGRKVRMSVRRYIRIKTAAALCVSILCGAIYGIFKVDLYFVFAACTFVLCYIPHVGNTFAVLAPLPLIFLDPEKESWDLVLCFILPFSIHQLAANLVEPKLLANSLDLHPIIVLMSLGFWGSIWGAVGAILSVPLTAVLRMVLLETNHPYAAPIAHLFKGEPAAAKTAPGGLQTDGSPIGAQRAELQRPRGHSSSSFPEYSNPLGEMQQVIWKGTTLSPASRTRRSSDRMRKSPQSLTPERHSVTELSPSDGPDEAPRHPIDPGRLATSVEGEPAADAAFNSL